MLLAVAVILALLSPLQQRALAKEVHFDADSPAGKEYALPLDQARDEAAGIGKSDGPAGKKAPLFGEGVSAGGSGPSAGGGVTGAGPGAGGNGAGDGSDAGTQESRRQAAAAGISGAEAGYALPSAILWVAAIVVLGGIVGLLLRAAQRPRSA